MVIFLVIVFVTTRDVRKVVMLMIFTSPAELGLVTPIEARTRPVKTAGGVNARASKAHLLEVATRLGIGGRWAMSRADLVAAIDTANRAASSKAAR